MIRGIVFDLWNCLARNTREPDPMRMLATAVGLGNGPEWGRRLERGMMLVPADGIAGALRQLEAREGLAIVDPDSRRAVVERWERAGEDAALYPDVIGTLDILRRRYRLGLCSNTQSFGLEFLDRERLWDPIDASAMSFEVGVLKPRPEIFRTACARLELAPETVLMVGDRLQADVHGAQAAGMHALQLLREDGPPGKSARAVATIREMAELPDWLAGLNAAG